MSNSTLAWLAIGLAVGPFIILAVLDRMSDPPDWLDSEGFEVLIGLSVAVAIFGLFPLVAAQGEVIDEGGVHLSGSVPEIIVSVITLIVVVILSVAMIGVSLVFIGLICLVLPYEFIFRRARRQWRIAKQVNRDFDADGFRIYETNGRYEPPCYRAVNGDPIYLIYAGWIRKVCAAVDGDRVYYYSRSGHRISPPFIFGFSYSSRFGSTLRTRGLLSYVTFQVLPHRLTIVPGEVNRWRLDPRQALK